MLKWLWSRFASAARSVGRLFRARYDAAQTVDSNRRHWANADTLSANAANSPDVLLKLRSRSRYECCHNNSYMGGMVTSYADFMVGTGPSLQLEPQDGVATEVECAVILDRWKEWFDHVTGAESIHLMSRAKSRDGETILLSKTDEESPVGVKCHPQVFECDQLSTPGLGFANRTSGYVDGIEMGPNGTPAYYHILKHHPGDGYVPDPLGFYRVPAQFVVHWFRRDRPGQCRGVPEVTAALPIGSQMRRWTLATLTATETAADFAAVIQTKDGASYTAAPPTAMDTLDIEQGMMTFLPGGYEMKQFDAKHPNTMYQAFKSELLKEMGRTLSMPYNIVAGDSSAYNFSSARLDWLLFIAALDVARANCTRNVVERMYQWWLQEALLIPGYLPKTVDYRRLKRTWFWPPHPVVDPIVEAQADTERLGNYTETLKSILTAKGRDYAAHIRQAGVEAKMKKAAGLEVTSEAAPTAKAPAV